MPAGLPTNAGKSTMNTYIQRNWLSGALTVRPNSFVDRVLISPHDSGLAATGVRYTDQTTGEQPKSTPTSWWSRPDRSARPRF